MGARWGWQEGAGEWGTGFLTAQAHLHELELEVVLEGVGSDEAQFARCDGAGEEKEEQKEEMEEEEEV